jgi:hypothetical protein
VPETPLQDSLDRAFVQAEAEGLQDRIPDSPAGVQFDGQHHHAWYFALPASSENSGSTL